MKKLTGLFALLISTCALSFEIPLEDQIKSIQTIEVTASTDTETPKDPFERVGKVISTSKDMIALGESFYDLVKKGKPSNTTTYAAVSVVPKDPTTKEAVSPFDMEGFSMPSERTFKTRIKNGNGSALVTFLYKVIYSYGGSYNGKGKYLTNVMIVPVKVETSWGVDFSATMSLQGIMNHGSRENPIAGAMVAIKYQVQTWSSSTEANDVIHVTGNGELKSYGLK